MRMRGSVLISLFLFLSALSVQTELFAQSETIVVGSVTSSVDASPMAGVYVFTFKTFAEAKAEYRIASDSYELGYMPDFFKDVRTALDGTYEVTLPVGGGIIFYKHPYKPVLAAVKGRSKIDVVIEATRELPEAEVIGQLKQLRDPVIEEEMVIGSTYTKKMLYEFDRERLGEVNGVGRTNARVIAQAYVVKADSRDTLCYLPPQVFDGEQFHSTQVLWRKDTLYNIAEEHPRLTNGMDTVIFDVTFDVPDQSVYHCKAHIWVEDYIKTYYQDTCFILSTARVRRPFQFLEYLFEECPLDHQEWFKPPRKERITTPKNMKLRFKVGKAELDRADAATMAAISSLKDELRAICADPASKLKELHFKGFASPDGPYHKNKELSEKRTRTVQDEVMSVVPRDQAEMVYKTSQGVVCGWNEVADILERDSLMKEAEFVRGIVEASPDRLGRQDYLIRRHPYYDTVIKDRLDELRVVRCEHLAEVLRFLTPEEIKEKYDSDPSYRDGTGRLTLNEYWHLFALIKDQDELETLYRQAIAASVKIEGEPWVLPANNLAVMYIRREQADTSLLKPFLRDGRPMNYSEMNFDTGQRTVYNVPEVVANQARMFMIAGDFRRAVQLTDKVRTRYPLLDAVCKLLGRYRLDASDRQELYDMIEGSSDRNRVVMRLFQKQYDSLTVAALQALPQDDALTDYLKVQRLCGQFDGAAKMRMSDFDRSEDPGLKMPDDDVEGMEYVARSVYEVAYVYLKRCFERDKSYVDVARGDIDIDEELLNDVLGLKPDHRL